MVGRMKVFHGTSATGENAKMALLNCLIVTTETEEEEVFKQVYSGVNSFPVNSLPGKEG